jgi:hypothetical protein
MALGDFPTSWLLAIPGAIAALLVYRGSRAVAPRAGEKWICRLHDGRPVTVKIVRDCGENWEHAIDGASRLEAEKVRGWDGEIVGTGERVHLRREEAIRIDAE